jgi:hypothetical protein
MSSNTMSEELDEDVYYADNGTQLIGFDNDLEGIGASSTEIINIDTGYQPTWTPKEGFRENFQNWYVEGAFPHPYC